MGDEQKPPARLDADEHESLLSSLENGVAALTTADEERLARLLAHPSKHLRLRAAGALSTALSSERVTTGLCESLLASEIAETRWGAAFAASRAGYASARVLDVAMTALDLEDGDVRWAAAAIVAREARASDDLRERLRLLFSSGSPRARKMALLCLCECGVTDGELYRAALGDPDPFVRLAAITSLGRCGDRSAESLAAIRNASERDEDIRVRRGAGAIFSRLTATGGSPRIETRTEGSDDA